MKAMASVTRAARAAGEVASPGPGTSTAGTGGRRRRGHKRGRGEGSVGFHAPSGLWRGRLMTGRDALTGRPVVREVYAQTRGEAVARLDDLRRRHHQGALGDAGAERLTLAAFVDRWLRAKEGAVRPGTIDRYRRTLAQHALPSLGRARLNQLRPDAIQALYGQLVRRGGLSPRTVGLVHRILHAALAEAVRWGYLPANPCDRVTPPAVPRRELRPPSAAEVRRLIDTARDAADPYWPLWTAAAHTGCRVGELVALTWADLTLPPDDDAAGGARGDDPGGGGDEADPEAWGELRVRRTLLLVEHGRPVFGAPKTERGRRDVPLHPAAAAALRGLRAGRAGPALPVGQPAASDLVFTTARGTALNRARVSQALKRALARAGLPASVRFHDLRHAAATEMLAGGVDVPTAAAILGHSRNSVTLDVYGHHRPERLAAAIAALGRALRAEEGEGGEGGEGDGAPAPPAAGGGPAAVRRGALQPRIRGAS